MGIVQARMIVMPCPTCGEENQSFNVFCTEDGVLIFATTCSCGKELVKQTSVQELTEEFLETE